MAVVISSSIGGETILDPDASQLKKLRALNDVMKAGPPVVFIKGTAKANPTLDEVIAEYNRYNP